MHSVWLKSLLGSVLVMMMTLPADAQEDGRKRVFFDRPGSACSIFDFTERLLENLGTYAVPSANHVANGHMTGTTQNICNADGTFIFPALNYPPVFCNNLVDQGQPIPEGLAFQFVELSHLWTHGNEPPECEGEGSGSDACSQAFLDRVGNLWTDTGYRPFAFGPITNTAYPATTSPQHAYVESCCTWDPINEVWVDRLYSEQVQSALDHYNEHAGGTCTLDPEDPETTCSGVEILSFVDIFNQHVATWQSSNLFGWNAQVADQPQSGSYPVLNFPDNVDLNFADYSEHFDLFRPFIIAMGGVIGFKVALFKTSFFRRRRRVDDQDDD